MNRKINIKKISFSAVLLALALVLPFLTGQIPEIGNKLSPMHIPVLLCGFICGALYGFAVGFIAPVLRFLLFGMPPIFPVGLAMTFELAAYGFVAGLLYKKLAKTSLSVYISLIASMLIGRMVWGFAMFVISCVSMVEFNMSIFMAGAFINAVPGIIVHIAIIPLIVIPLKKAGYILS